MRSFLEYLRSWEAFVPSCSVVGEGKLEVSVVGPFKLARGKGTKVTWQANCNMLWGGINAILWRNLHLAVIIFHERLVLVRKNERVLLKLIFKGD